MKIGFDISDLVAGQADGTTRYTYELAKRLPELAPQHEWLFFAPGDVHENYSLLEFPNAKLIKSPFPKYWTQARLWLDLYKHKPDVLFMPIQQLPILRPRRMKTGAVVHDLAVHKFPQQFTWKDWALLHIFSAQVAREADEIIAVSQATKDDIQKFYGRAENVSVVHHGLDHEKFKPQEYSDRIVSEKYILYVGQIQPRKNLARLIEAFEALQLNDLNLVIAGGYGWLQKPILKRIESSPAKEKIKLLGRVADEKLPQLYSQAEVFVLPSLYEGFGMPVLEAMACGTPVVTSNVSSLPEVAGNAAVLVDPNSAENISQGIKKAIADKEKLRVAGLQHAVDFDWDETARQTLARLGLS